MSAMESMGTTWRSASALKRALLIVAPVAVIAALAGGVAFAAMGGGDDGATKAEAVAPTATAVLPTSTPMPPTPTNEQVLAYLVAIAPTPTPVPPGPAGVGRAPTGGGGGGGTPRQYVPQPALSGPGPILSTGMSLTAPGISGSIFSRTVGDNGKMGDPGGPWQIIWYDFNAWPGLGGFPGTPGANAVFAGHVDYIRVGPAVFWNVKDLKAGDIVSVTTANGPVNYQVQWSQWAGPNDDFTSYVQQTGQEVITLVTCIGGFSAGHYTNRLIVRGVRI